MRRILASSLRPGMVFDQPLFTRYGAMVLRAGEPLTRDAWRRLVATREGRPLILCMAESRTELPEFLPPSEFAAPLPPVEEPAVSGDGEDVLNEFAAMSVAARREDAESRLTAAAARWDAIPRRVEPERARGARSGDAGAGSFSLCGYAAVVGGIVERLSAGASISPAPILTIVDDLIDRATSRPAALAASAVAREPDTAAEPLHACRVAALSLAVGARLGWGVNDLRIVGAASLLADCGMCLVGFAAVSSPRPLDDGARTLLNRHPGFSAGILAAQSSLPEEVLLAISQHHERDDGSGYPRARKARDISDHARLFAVCETFIAAASERPHRRAAEPHAAVRTVLEMARRGTLWDAAAAELVRLVGLYPVGSRVRLSGDEAATVVAVPEPSMPHRPIVQVRWGRDEVRTIDLSREVQTSIVGALPSEREW